MEAFRRADLVDVSQGLVRGGLPRPYVREVRAAFDVGNFFKKVVPLAVAKRLVTPCGTRCRTACAREGRGLAEVTGPEGADG